MTELKPCPFCGQAAKLRSHRFTGEFTRGTCIGIVECDNCNIYVARCATTCEAACDQAIERWNTRAAVMDKDFATAVHDGELWEKRRECRNFYGDEGRFVCSKCGWMALNRVAMNGRGHGSGPVRFCPHCGAKVVE